MPNNRLFIHLCLSILSITSTPAFASTYDIAAIEIDGLHQKDGGGDYDKVISVLNATKVMSPAAAQKFFESGKAECLSPANTDPNFYSYDFPVISSNSMFQAKVFIYANQEISSITDLSGKKVGIRKGMPYGNKIDNSGLNFIQARDIETNIKRLKSGKIDAFIAYWPDSEQAFKNLDVMILPHAVNSPLAVHDDQVVCRDSAKGKSIIQAINQKIGE